MDPYRNIFILLVLLTLYVAFTMDKTIVTMDTLRALASTQIPLISSGFFND